MITDFYEILNSVKVIEVFGVALIGLVEEKVSFLCHNNKKGNKYESRNR